MSSTTSDVRTAMRPEPSQHPPRDVLPDILGTLLREQAAPAAVEVFAEWHDTSESPRQEPYYRSLLPAQAPGPGQQYAFEVDLDGCTACKGCVTACHSLNGLDDGETWRSVGFLQGGTAESPYRQAVTTACHHCIEPACLTGCPVDAYEKDPVTGIVRHLDDQCIGCRYCILTCPYEVPKFNPSRGIVRKCDLCSERLEVGEAPACVQGCPNDAIRISLVDTAQLTEELVTDSFLPGTPDPKLSLPTTRYRSRRSFPEDVHAVDAAYTPLQEAHPSLTVMLTVTQLAVGAFIVGTWWPARESPVSAPWVALACAAVALASSILHLGRPQYAFRAIIGLRHSWLSREILAFGLFFGMSSLYVLVEILGGAAPPGWARALMTGAGLSAVLASSAIYVVTGRPTWATIETPAKFLLTAALLGSLTHAWIGTAESWSWLVGMSGSEPVVSPFDLTRGGTAESWWGSLGVLGPARDVLMIALLAGTLKLLVEAYLLGAFWGKGEAPRRRAARLLLGRLRHWTIARWVLGIAGSIALPVYLLGLPGPPPTDLALMALCLSGAGELVERHLFFVGASGPRMPGDIP